MINIAPVILQAALGFVVGAILGSFVNALAYRLPRGISIVAPRSSCPSCQTTLRARELVPLLSWLISRGRCAHCGAAIGRRYLYVELAMAVTSAAIFALFWSQAPVLFAGLFLSAAAATRIAVTADRRSGRL